MKNLLLIRDICGTLWQQAINSVTTANGSGGSESKVATTSHGNNGNNGNDERWIVSTSIDSPSQRLFACSSDHLLIAFDLHSAKVNHATPTHQQQPSYHCRPLATQRAITHLHAVMMLII